MITHTEKYVYKLQNAVLINITYTYYKYILHPPLGVKKNVFFHAFYLTDGDYLHVMQQSRPLANLGAK